MHRCQLFCHNQEIYLNEHMQVAKHWLFHDGGSGRIETSPLICSANQWTGFCIIGTSVMEDSRCSSHSHTPRVCSYVLQSIICFFCVSFFFYLAFLSQTFSLYPLYPYIPYILHISLYPFYHFHPLHRLSDISWVIAAESSPLHIAGSRNRTRNLWYTLFRIHSFCTCTGSCCC